MAKNGYGVNPREGEGGVRVGGRERWRLGGWLGEWDGQTEKDGGRKGIRVMLGKSGTSRGRWEGRKGKVWTG